MEIRTLEKEERLLIHNFRKYAFNDWNADEVKDEELESLIPEIFIGLFDNNELLSMLRCYNFRQSVRGTIKNMGGGCFCLYPTGTSSERLYKKINVLYI